MGSNNKIADAKQIEHVIELIKTVTATSDRVTTMNEKVTAMCERVMTLLEQKGLYGENTRTYIGGSKYNCQTLIDVYVHYLLY